MRSRYEVLAVTRYLRYRVEDLAKLFEQEPITNGACRGWRTRSSANSCSSFIGSFRSRSSVGPPSRAGSDGQVHRELEEHAKDRSARDASPMASRAIPVDVEAAVKAEGEARALERGERIRGELLKLAIHVSKRTIKKYIRAVRRTPRMGSVGERSLGTTCPILGPAILCRRLMCFVRYSHWCSSSCRRRCGRD